ncbi:hypothetical protein BKA64DRAFT_712243 [Cadophora sp. MPI-SDFR-AT-0126]|nr:hypothetical protein BKA64DRAFT_712243 [Leotiomycetes sp. MPI-SDFR-AT-0126]
MKFAIFTTALFTASSAAAVTFKAFPSQVTCELSSGGPATFTTAELEAIASAGISGTPFESSAANTASGRCSSLQLPYYSSGLGKGAGQLYYVYDSKADVIEFCTADTPIVTEPYPVTCDF